MCASRCLPHPSLAHLSRPSRPSSPRALPATAHVDACSARPFDAYGHVQWMNERSAFVAFQHPHHCASATRESPGAGAGGARQPQDPVVAHDAPLLAEAAVEVGVAGREEGGEEGQDECGCCRARACVAFEVCCLPACQPPAVCMQGMRRSAAGARCLAERLLQHLHADNPALAQHIVQLVEAARNGGGIFARSSGSARGDGAGAAAAEASVNGGSSGLDVVLWEHLHAVASAGGACKE